MNILVIA